MINDCFHLIGGQLRLKFKEKYCQMFFMPPTKKNNKNLITIKNLINDACTCTAKNVNITFYTVNNMQCAAFFFAYQFIIDPLTNRLMDFE